MDATAPSVPSNTVRDGSAVEMAWRRLSSASVSTAAPGRAAAGLPTDCQPRAGVRILTMSPAAARMSPLSSAVAVTEISPLCGMTTSSGSSQRFPAASPAMPPRMTVPACPTRRRSTVLRPEGLRRRPLILTMRDSPVPCAVAGE